MPTSTPWGAAQHSIRIARGIVGYATAGHGGYHLTKTRVDSMPAALLLHAKKQGCIKNKGDGWFEQDLMGAFVVLAFPECFKSEAMGEAEKVVRNWYPDAWEAFYGRILMNGESKERDRLVFMELHKKDYLTTGAWGSWAMHVPEGKVGVAAILGGWRPGEPNEVTYWLVAKEDYDARKGLPLVIDLQRHQRLAVELGSSKPSEKVECVELIA